MTEQIQKIWFNSKVCYIPTSNLVDLTKTQSADDVAKLGAPIGVLSVDTAWGEWGALTYSAEGLAKLKEYRFGYINADMDKALEYSEWVSSNNGEINKIEDKDWVNVYGIEEFSFDRDEDMRNIPGIDPSEIEPWIITGKSILFTITERFAIWFKEDESRETFTYYPGNGFSKTLLPKRRLFVWIAANITPLHITLMTTTTLSSEILHKS